MSTEQDIHWYRIHVKNPGDFLDREFINLCSAQLGMDEAGAKKHYNMLKKYCPNMYTYVCRTRINGEEYHRYMSDTNYQVLDIQCFDDHGEPLPGYAYVFKYEPHPIVPAGYKELGNAPEDTEIRVCWGSLTTKIEYGTAKRFLGKWYIYGQLNPHANGRSCATPTGWYQEP